MIRRLQNKFVLIAMGSLLMTFAIIIGGVSAFISYHTRLIADNALSVLAEHDGKLPESVRYRAPGTNPLKAFLTTADTLFETRYFTVKTFSDSSDMLVDTNYISSVSADQAARYAMDVLERGRSRGYEDVYRYLVVEKPDGKLVVFLDQYTSIHMMGSFFWASCGIALFILAVMFVPVSVLSKRAIKPIADSFEKQKQFITDAGHEIKTPLAIISANTDVLELSQGQNEWADSIRRQTNRLDDLVKSLLALSRMEEEKTHLVLTDFSISGIALEEAFSFETLAKSQGKTFGMDIQPDLIFHGDENGIRQVVSILMDNAVKYAGDGGEIRVALQKQGRLLCLEARNTVDAMPEGDLTRLFDRFFRADPSRSRESGGYGLGLSIAKAVVQSHKGKITVRRESDSWILFSVTFKLPAEP